MFLCGNPRRYCGSLTLLIAFQSTPALIGQRQPENPNTVNLATVLIPPDERDHERGKTIVLEVLNATAYFKGHWVLGNGLAAVQLLECAVGDRIAYESMFLSLARGPKLMANASGNAGLLLGYEDGGYVPKTESESIVYRREAILTAAARGIRARFMFDAEGEWGRIYEPNDRTSNDPLTKTLSAGLELYEELNESDYRDKTLRDSLGMVFAVIEFDREFRHGIDILSLVNLGPLQIYRDALLATLSRLAEESEHSADFLEELSTEMGLRGLSEADTFLLPDLEQLDQHQRLLQLIAADLDHIRSREQ